MSSTAAIVPALALGLLAGTVSEIVEFLAAVVVFGTCYTMPRIGLAGLVLLTALTGAAIVWAWRRRACLLLVPFWVLLGVGVGVGGGAGVDIALWAARGS